MTNQVICIVGPTGVGKTTKAFELAKALDGEVINLDKIYTYKKFLLATGLSDSKKETSVKKHLYEFLEPDDPIIDPGVYAKMVRSKVKEILERGKTAIIEGGSTTYFPALYWENEKNNFIQHIFGLRFAKDFDVAQKISQRFDKVWKQGLLEEVKMGLTKYPNSLIMKDCHFVVPVARYINGEIDIEQAKEEVLKRNLEYIKKQMLCFETFPKIEWLEQGK